MTKPSQSHLQKALNSSTPTIPPPFTPAPSSLSSFLSALRKEQVYITHIDLHPAWFKRRIFTVPVLLNLVILALLLWRAITILPWYTAILTSTLNTTHSGFQTSSAAPDTWKSFVSTVALRALTFLLDYLLVTIVWPWPLSFFFDRPHSPVSWRWVIGFREREVVVRVSRKWGAEELVGGRKRGGESPFFKTRVVPAVGKERMGAKTGYLLMDRDWDLDFGVMVRAHELVDKGEVKLGTLHGTVFVWVGGSEDGRWCVWDVEGKKDEEMQSEGTEEGRRKIFEFRDRLTAMGKEELFFKWVELVQEEISKPGGFTKERQFETGLKVQALFEEYGVNFEEFAQISGLTGGQT